MEKTKTQRYHRSATKVLAVILAVVLVGTLALNAAVSVKISRGDTGEAATNYLVESTDYVNENRVQRLSSLAGTLGQPSTLEDYYRLAETQIAGEKYEEALSSVEHCLQLFYGGDRELEIDLWLKRACLQVLLGYEDEALTSLDTVANMDPNLASIYLIRAQIYAGREDMVPLAEALETYLSLKPGDSDVRALLAQAMFTAGDFTGATEQYQTILDTAKPEQDVSQTAYLYALTCIQTGDFQTAEDNLTAALKKTDALDGIYYYRGVCRMSLEHYAAAIEDFTASIGKHDMEQESYYSRGLCRMMASGESYDKAKSDLQKAVKLDGTNQIGQQAASLLKQLKAAEQDAADEVAKAAAAEKAAQAAAAAGQAAGSQANAGTSGTAASSNSDPGQTPAASQQTPDSGAKS